MEELTYSQIVQELEKTDEVLANLFQSVEKDISPSVELDVYRSLLHSIVSQQLSTKVADVIWNRFLGLFDDGYPQAQRILDFELDQMRSIGLSYQKAGYMKNVAEFNTHNDMGIEFLSKLSDEEVIKYLTQIKGVGRWTVQMILMFPMDRHDVFPVDDLGIQTKMKTLYNIKLEKKELKNKMHEISEKWRPFRSIACKYIWKYG